MWILHYLFCSYTMTSGKGVLVFSERLFCIDDMCGVARNAVHIVCIKLIIYGWIRTFTISSLFQARHPCKVVEIFPPYAAADAFPYCAVRPVS